MKFRWKKFFSYYRPYRGLFAAVLACAFLVAAITLILPLGIRYITKDVLENGLADARNRILMTGAGMVLLILIQTLCNYFVDYRGHAMGAMMESDMREELFDHLQKLPFRFYDEQRTGQLMSRITNDLLSLAEFYHHAPEDYLIYMVRFIGALVILLRINVTLTLVILLFLPIMLVFAYFFNVRMHDALKRNKERIADINAQVEDTLAGIRVVKSFTNESTEREKFTYTNNRFLESRQRGYQSESYLYQGINTFTLLMTVAVVVFGALRIVSGTIDLADLLVFLLYITAIVEPIQKFSHVAGQFQEGITSYERFMEIMEIPPEIQDAPNAIILPRAQGRVTFQNVAFRYREDHYDILKNINLDILPGEYVAVVGTSGVGKTTLCSLIPRFYEVSEGRILLDGIPIKDLSLQSLRANIGVVQQDVYLFAGTIFDNICYGKPGAAREEVVAAARAANAHDFIASMPNGYDTDIGQRGVKLSGGQKQRLSIARVFLKDPPILIFDEATSSLDSESEKVVQDSLETLARHRTTFVIAHRLSTIQNARRIIVLTDRGIEEQGTHAELIALSGKYAHLYNM